jgi:hypothetical protein
VRVERLPAYAPELNPVEFLWGHLKNHHLANLTPDALWKLSKAARNALFIETNIENATLAQSRSFAALKKDRSNVGRRDW